MMDEAHFSSGGSVPQWLGKIIKSTEKKQIDLFITIQKKMRFPPEFDMLWHVSRCYASVLKHVFEMIAEKMSLPSENSAP